MDDKRLTLISPATATHNPRITKVINLINAGFNPFNLEELSLIPTACVYNPRLVNFKTRAMMIIQITAIKNGVGIGTPGINPPKYLKVGSLMIGSSLLLIQAAMDLPAVNKISVATMG